jgi:hypothetical protein
MDPMPILEFIFSSFWRWLGMCLLLAALGSAIGAAARAVGGHCGCCRRED